MWGDFIGITLDVKLIGGAPYDPLYEEMIPIWEEKTGGKVSILSKKSHFSFRQLLSRACSLTCDLTWFNDLDINS